MVSIWSIQKKYRKHVSFLYVIRKIDLFVLEKALKKLYKPRKRCHVMAVGGMFGEKDLLKTFHMKNYDTAVVKVGSCNLLPSYMLYSLDYDFWLTGKKGDASKKSTWNAAKKNLGIDKFDLVYIRFPDIFKRNNWETVVKNARLNITKKGAVFMLVRQQDEQKLDSLIKKQKPFLDIKTGVEFLGGQSKTFYRAVVFRCPT